MVCSRCGGALTKNDEGYYVCGSCGAVFKAAKKTHPADSIHNTGVTGDSGYAASPLPPAGSMASAPVQEQTPQQEEPHVEEEETEKPKKIRKKKGSAFGKFLKLVIVLIAIAALLKYVVFPRLGITGVRRRIIGAVTDKLPLPAAIEDKLSEGESLRLQEQEMLSVSEDAMDMEVPAPEEDKFNDSNLVRKAFPDVFRLTGNNLLGGSLLLEENALAGMYHIVINTPKGMAELWTAGDGLLKCYVADSHSEFGRVCEVPEIQYKDDGEIDIAAGFGKYVFGPSSVQGLKKTGAKEMEGVTYDEYTDGDGISYLINPGTESCDYLLVGSEPVTVEKIPVVTMPEYEDVDFEEVDDLSSIKDSLDAYMKAVLTGEGSGSDNDISSGIVVVIDPADYPGKEVYVNGSVITERSEFNEGTAHIKIVDKDGSVNEWTQ